MRQLRVFSNQAPPLIVTVFFARAIESTSYVNFKLSFQSRNRIWLCIYYVRVKDHDSKVSFTDMHFQWVIAPVSCLAPLLHIDTIFTEHITIMKFYQHVDFCFHSSSVWQVVKVRLLMWKSQSKPLLRENQMKSQARLSSWRLQQYVSFALIEYLMKLLLSRASIINFILFVLQPGYNTTKPVHFVKLRWEPWAMKKTTGLSRTNHLKRGRETLHTTLYIDRVGVSGGHFVMIEGGISEKNSRNQH